MSATLSEPPAEAAPAPPPARRRSLLRAPVDFWVKPIRAEPLALFRILLGTTVLLSSLFSLLPRLDLYLGKDGICPPEPLDPWLKKTGRFSLLRGPVSLPLLGHWLPEKWAEAVPWLDGWVSEDAAERWRDWGAEPAAGYAAFGAWMLSLVTLTLGWRTRLSSVVAWALATSIECRLAWLSNGGDSLLRAGLFYLMLSPAGAAWSLDALRRQRKAARRGEAPAGPVLIPPWSVRLMQIQFALVYFFTGLVKLSGPYFDDDGNFTQDWLNGEAVYWVINDIAVARWPYAWLPVPLAVCRLLSWATLSFEIGFPLFVLFRRLRPWLLLAGVAFHLGIWVHTEVGWFSPVSLCWYALFLSGERVERVARSARHLAAGQARRAPSPTPAPGKPGG